MTESSIGGEQTPGRDRSRPRRVPAAERPGSGASTTADRILDAALASFATRGYDASSLDALAAGLEIRKQTILYWFPSKEVLLEAVIDRSAIDLSTALEESLAVAGSGWSRVEA
ncbi:MAG: helix-turn-helix domain-containing protein, partial [Acidimicrobiales bacterium]